MDRQEGRQAAGANGGATSDHEVAKTVSADVTNLLQERLLRHLLRAEELGDLPPVVQR